MHSTSECLVTATAVVQVRLELPRACTNKCCVRGWKKLGGGRWNPTVIQCDVVLIWGSLGDEGKGLGRTHLPAMNPNLHFTQDPREQAYVYNHTISTLPIKNQDTVLEESSQRMLSQRRIVYCKRRYPKGAIPEAMILQEIIPQEVQSREVKKRGQNLMIIFFFGGGGGNEHSEPPCPTAKLYINSSDLGLPPRARRQSGKATRRDATRGQYSAWAIEEINIKREENIYIYAISTKLCQTRLSPPPSLSSPPPVWLSGSSLHLYLAKTMPGSTTVAIINVVLLPHIRMP